MAEFDLQITGGTVVDGTRVPRYQADIWIKDVPSSAVAGDHWAGARVLRRGAGRSIGFLT